MYVFCIYVCAEVSTEYIRTKYIYFKDSVCKDKRLHQGFHLFQSPQLPPSTDHRPQLRRASQRWVPWPSTHTETHSWWWLVRCIQGQLLCLKCGWPCNLCSRALSLWIRQWLVCLRSLFLFSLPFQITMYTLPYRTFFWRAMPSANHKYQKPCLRLSF